MRRPFGGKGDIELSKTGPINTASLAFSERGRAETLDRLYRECRQDLCRFIRKRFGAGPPEPEEVAQVAFERITKLDSLDEINNLRSFLFTTAANAALDLRRRAATQATLYRDFSYHNFNSSEISPEDVLESEQRLETLKAALANMPTQRRRIFLLIRAEGLSVAETAERFGMSEAAVYKHISRAMQDCLTALELSRGYGK